MKNLFLIIAFLITYSLALANDENAIFDTNRTDPQTLLHHEYQKSKILFLGFANHANHKHIDQLRELLKQTYPGLGKKLIDGSCKATDVTVHPIYYVSTNREEDTAKNFYRDIWSKLGPNDKAIVLYNRGHLLTSFKACSPTMLSLELFESNYKNLAWIDDFYQMAPEAKEQSSLIILDEKYNESKDGTTFKFSRRQSLRYPDVSGQLKRDISAN
jgi:hypothetical protein